MTATTRLGRTFASPDDWMRNGLCAQTDPALFFPEGRGGAVAQQTKTAKQICNRCPVKLACLEWSLDTEQATGTWGGLSEDERKILLRQRRAAGRNSGYARCLDEQEYIERRVSDQASHRQIALELGVGHWDVGRAWQLFELERQMSQDGQVAAA